jgi:hypothetical protein
VTTEHCRAALLRIGSRALNHESNPQEILQFEFSIFNLQNNYGCVDSFFDFRRPADEKTSRASPGLPIHLPGKHEMYRSDISPEFQLGDTMVYETVSARFLGKK